MAVHFVFVAIIALLLSNAGVALSTVELSGTYLMGGVVGLLLFVALGLWRIEYALVAAFVVIYNPYFVFHYLIMEFIRGGGVRASISFVVVLLLAAVVFLRGSVHHSFQRVSTPLDFPLLISFLFIIQAVVYGYLSGHDTRILLYDLFPIFEFYSFFFLFTFLLKKQQEVKRFFVGLLLWNLAILIFDLIVLGYYQMTGQKFSYALTLSGVSINRLPDLVIPIILSSSIGLVFFSENLKIKWISGIVLVVSLLTAFLSFWRTLIIAALLPLILSVCFLFFRRGQNVLKRSFIILAFSAALFFTLNAISSKISFFNGNSLGQLFVERIMTAFDETQSNTISDRLSNNYSMIMSIMSHPLLGVGFGAMIEDAAGNAYYVSDTSNYYLRIVLFFGLFGFAVFSWVGVRYVRHFLRTFSSVRNRFHKGVMLSVILMQISICIILLAFPNVVHYPLGAYMGMTVALVFIISSIEKKKRGVSSSVGLFVLE